MTGDNLRVRGSIVTESRRFETGLIATLARDGETTVRHFEGAGRAATRALIAYCLAGGWRIRSISTPDTILRDLQGHREVAHAGRAASAADLEFGERSVQFPEPLFLRGLGHTDLFERHG